MPWQLLTLLPGAATLDTGLLLPSTPGGSQTAKLTPNHSWLGKGRRPTSSSTCLFFATLFSPPHRGKNIYTEQGTNRRKSSGLPLTYCKTKQMKNTTHEATLEIRKKALGKDSMLSNTIWKGKQCEERHRFSVELSQEVKRGTLLPLTPTLCPTLTTYTGGGRKVAPYSPRPRQQHRARAPPVVCMYTENPAMAVLSVIPTQTFCIEEIPAHLVSFLLLLASARTICGVKCHALMDRRGRWKKGQRRNRSSGENL